MYLSGLWILLLALTQVNLELQGWGELGWVLIHLDVRRKLGARSQ
jgi:hypothetical protein